MIENQNGLTVHPQNYVLANFPSNSTTNATFIVQEMVHLMANCGVPQLQTMTRIVNGGHVPLKNMKAILKASAVSFHSSTMGKHSILAPIKIQRMEDFGVLSQVTITKTGNGATVLIQDCRPGRPIGQYV
uniref:Uncharacterized protein n=1 Tax=Micrurus carvalhoi TaxID=3147026 RepID=A0A2H6N0X8_9SAUR